MTSISSCSNTSQRRTAVAAALCAILSVISQASDSMQPSAIQVLAKNGAIVALSTGDDAWIQFDTRSGSMSPMRSLGIGPNTPCVIGGFTIDHGRINGVDILEHYHPQYGTVVNGRTVMMGGPGVQDAIVSWPLGNNAVVLDRKPHAAHEASRFFAGDRNTYWVAAELSDDAGVATGQWILQRFPDGLTVRPPSCIITAFEVIGKALYLGTTNGLLKVRLTDGGCTLIGAPSPIKGIERLLHQDLNWTHVITGKYELPDRTLYTGYFDHAASTTSFIISGVKGALGYIPVPIAGLHQIIPIDKNRVALAGCMMKKRGKSEYSYVGGVAIYNLKTDAITVINNSPATALSYIDGLLHIERTTAAGIGMVLMEHETVTYDIAASTQTERTFEEVGLDAPEKYAELKSVHDAVLARRAALPPAKPARFIARPLNKKAVISTEQISYRMVPITESVRKITGR